MSTESEIKAALDTITTFKGVKFVVQNAGDDTQPYPLPFCVFTMGIEDFESFHTMCGASLSVQPFDLFIYAESTTQCQDLASQSILALSGIGVLAAIITEFEPDLRCYITSVSFT
jgi:hypothetical protein